MKITVFSEVTIDGKLTTGKGVSSRVLLDRMAEKDLILVHEFRSQVDAILVGMNTIRVDNPSLTCRYGAHPKNPIRIVPTVSMKIPTESTVWQDDVETIFLTVEENQAVIDGLEKRPHKQFIMCGHNEIDFVKVTEILERDYGISSIMIEGGGEINWAFFQNLLVDEIILLQLPIIVGGRDNVSLVGGSGISRLEELDQFELVSCEPRESCCVLKYAKRNNE